MTERSCFPLQPSLSFSGTASTSRSLKRRRASQSLCGSSLLPEAAQSLSTSREMAPTVAPLDPSDTDHKAIFLHPPFNAFPDAHKYPQGLTYAVMAQNPDWFLDANDFTSPTNTNPVAIHYPAQLEPPRGWCPAKKRDLKDKGVDGWPEGGEPRLRCTFCRRTYAGVNAKSMWRRHVYEKHKIAMANRRDNANAERSRRRGSAKAQVNDNKENKKQQKRIQDSGSETDASQEEKSTDHPIMVADNMPEPLAPHAQDENPSGPSHESSSVPAGLSTPYTPHSFSSKTRRSIIAASPYDPLVTPTFRHSTPRLPSDQPWRFPSPSHPLHSAARELSLASVVQGDVAALRSSGALDVSPIIFGPKASVTDSPPITFPLSESRGFVHLSSVKRTPGFPKPSPRRLFSLPTPRRWRLPDSPGEHNLRTPKSSSSSTLSASASCSSLESELPISPIAQREGTLMEPIRLAGEDPFTDIYNSWIHLGDSNHKSSPIKHYTPPSSSPEDSPVIRTGLRPTADETMDCDDMGASVERLVLMYSREREGSDTVASIGLGISPSQWNDDHAWDEIAPPSKRRRIEASS